ncbi:hypothetical protein [Maribacter aestuarii]|uniref:hypothetical protein n=1 Tax=Maribacter aestuarii TaxID=1130723 RepID=UPI00248B0109|nr:hypothetical protein [Maribacter aestuarii]
MTSFNELKSEWGNQPEMKPSQDDFQTMLKRIKTIKNKQRITNVILGITLLVLCFFFIYISGYKNNTVIIGLSLMIGSLVVRIGIEVLSIKKLKSLNVLLKPREYKSELTSYYKNRTLVHYVFTPLIIAIYCSGFILLLPLFKASLSSGFYTYIVISSIVVLFVLGSFIVVQIRRELTELKRLKQSDNG